MDIQTALSFVNLGADAYSVISGIIQGRQTVTAHDPSQ